MQVDGGESEFADHLTFLYEICTQSMQDRGAETTLRQHVDPYDVAEVFVPEDQNLFFFFRLVLHFCNVIPSCF